MATVDTYAIAPRFGKFLRLTDVVDALDAVGRADLTLVDPTIRPLWFGMKFWGPAVTMRVIPTNQRMPVLNREEARRQHPIWNDTDRPRSAPSGTREAGLRDRHLDRRRRRVWLLGFE